MEDFTEEVMFVEWDTCAHHWAVYSQVMVMYTDGCIQSSYGSCPENILSSAKEINMHEIKNRTTYGYMCDTNALKFLELKFIFPSLCYIRHLKNN